MRGRVSDEWGKEAEEGEVTMIHHGPRPNLFTPVGVKDVLPARAAAKSRITIGQFLTSGEKFRIVDNWATRGTAHGDLGVEWAGSTTFLVVSG